MVFVDINGIMNDDNHVIKSSKRRKKLSFSGYIFRFGVLSFFIIAFFFITVGAFNSVEDIKKVIADNSFSINNLIKERYKSFETVINKNSEIPHKGVSAKEMAEIETAAGEDAELDSLLDWEEPVKDKPASTASPVSEPVKKEVSSPIIKPNTEIVETKVQEHVQAVEQPQIASNTSSVGEKSKLEELEKNVANLIKGKSKDTDLSEIKRSMASMNRDMAEIKRQMMILSNKVIELDDRAKNPSSKNDAVKTASSSKSTGGWRLRSAKGEVAWISQTGSDELVAVGVGDDVVGIGKVEKVGRDDKGRWYVKGSSGNITQ